MDDKARRQQLRCRLARRFTLDTRHVTIAGVRLAMTVVACPDEVLSAMESAGGSSASDRFMQPYWAATWESSWGIAEALAENELAGRRILDLGCGMGLLGAYLASREALVTMADASRDAILFARLNAWPWRRRARAIRLDWRRDQLNESFELVVGADILYDPSEWTWLESFWRTHLAPGGDIVLGEPRRASADAFPEWISRRGWRLQATDMRLPTRSQPLRLWRLRWASRE